MVVRGQVYAAAALMEWQGERTDKVPRNIFELGLRHFLGEPGYVAAYAGWLVTANDAPNARALYERALAAQPPPDAARALWDHYLKVSTMFLQDYDHQSSSSAHCPRDRPTLPMCYVSSFKPHKGLCVMHKLA